jgi:hypothetical protein
MEEMKAQLSAAAVAREAELQKALADQTAITENTEADATILTGDASRNTSTQATKASGAVMKKKGKLKLTAKEKKDRAVCS